MNANQSGMNDTPRVDAKASTPSLVSSNIVHMLREPEAW